MELTKDERIKKEYRKLSKLYKGIPENKRKLAEGLLKNAAYMAVTLEELQETVNAEGAILTGKNGNGFEVCQEHPAQKSYNTTINRYATVIKQLSELLPEEQKAAVSKLDKFLNE